MLVILGIKDILKNENHSLILKSGIGSKMGAVYGTGYNNYYCVDMVTNIPNAYFSQVLELLEINWDWLVGTGGLLGLVLLRLDNV